MKLQKASRYALYAVLHLASDPDRQQSTADIAEEYGISIHHLAKVMRTLVRSGLLLFWMDSAVQHVVFLLQLVLCLLLNSKSVWTK